MLGWRISVVPEDVSLLRSEYGTDNAVRIEVNRLPRKRSCGSDWLKVYLRRLAAIMIDEFIVLGMPSPDDCGHRVCSRRDRMRATRAQTRADISVFLVGSFPE